MFQVLKPLYRHGDSGDYWRVSFDRYAKEDLHMISTNGDPSLYILIFSLIIENAEHKEEARGSWACR